MNDNRTRITAEELEKKSINDFSELSKYRIIEGDSLHDDFQPLEKCIHYGRTVYCHLDIDVVECRKCGYQYVAKCNFDEEYD